MMISITGMRKKEKKSCFVTMTVACGLSNEKRKENMV